MNLITLSFNNTIPKYKQLYNKIKQDIINNNLKRNEKLPSKRLLAKHLNTSLNTIVNAYSMLLSEGYIISKEKQGYYVSNLDFQANFINENTKTTTISSLLYDFTTKNIDNSIFPINSYIKITKSLLESKKTLIKTPNKGSLELRETIKNYLYEQKGFKVNTTNIIIGSGIEYLLTIICNIIDKPRVLLENPCYNKIKDIFINNNKTISYFKNTDEELVLDNSSSGGEIIYLTPASQFPTGNTMSINNKKKIIEYSNKNNSIIIEDDFDSEFRIIGNPPITIYSLNSNQTIYMFSFSRSVAPSIRLSFMILPDLLLENYNKKYEGYSTTVSSLEQLTLNEFIKSGLYTRHINRLKLLYHQKREIILNYIESKNNIYEIIKANSYLSIIVNVLIKIDDIKFKKSLENYNIEIRFLKNFDNDVSNNNIIIIGYSNINKDELTKALDTITCLLLNCKV